MIDPAADMGQTVDTGNIPCTVHFIIRQVSCAGAILALLDWKAPAEGCGRHMLAYVTVADYLGA